MVHHNERDLQAALARPIALVSWGSRVVRLASPSHQILHVRADPRKMIVQGKPYARPTAQEGQELDRPIK